MIQKGGNSAEMVQALSVHRDRERRQFWCPFRGPCWPCDSGQVIQLRLNLATVGWDQISEVVRWSR